MNNNKKMNIETLLIVGFFMLFLPVIRIIGVVLIVIGINEIKKKRTDQNKYTVDLQEDDITQEDVHAHDFTEVEEDDVTQQQVHAHDSWNNEGPIKYCK